MSRDSPRRFRPAVIAWIALGAVTLALVAIVAAVGIGAFVAQKELRAAVPVVSKMQDQFGSDDRVALDSSIQELQAHADAARSATDTWVWWLAEQAAFIGPSLHAVRESTVAVDELAKGVLPPLVDVDPAVLRPAGGAFDISALTQLAGPIAEAADSAERASGALSDVRLQDTPGVLREPLSKLTSAVGALQPALSRAEAVLPHLPEIMGQNGPRNYLLLVQNNAEARGTGGIPASIVLLRFDNGKIEIIQQASSSDFSNDRAAPILPLDPEVVKLYDDKIGRWSQDMTATPDFTLSADLAREWWSQRYKLSVDGVISIDPVALSYILGATGPITLETGDVLASDDAVRILLSDVYARYPRNDAQDAFFASAAVKIFDAISAGRFGPVPFASAIVRAVDENRVYFHSFDPAVEGAFIGSRLSGPLPSNQGSSHTTLGVFVNDLTEAKLSYYTDMSAEVRVDRCSATPTYTVIVSFTNDLDPAISEGLGMYVNAGKHYPKGTIGTDLQFYGPEGGSFVSAAFDGADVSITTGDHLGRPVGRMWVVNAPQMVHTLAVKFEGLPEDSRDVSLVHTPMVNAVPTTVVDTPCG